MPRRARRNSSTVDRESADRRVIGRCGTPPGQAGCCLHLRQQQRQIEGALPGTVARRRSPRESIAAGRSGNRDSPRATPNRSTPVCSVDTRRHGCRAALASQVQRRTRTEPADAVTTRQSAPNAAPAGSATVGAQPVNGRLKIRGVERHAGDRVEHRVGPSVLEHAVVARQQQRRVVVGGDEDEHRRTERRDGFETDRGWRRDAGREPAANTTAAGRAAQRRFPRSACECRGRRRWLARAARRRRGARRAGAGRQLHQRRGAHDSRRTGLTPQRTPVATLPQHERRTTSSLVEFLSGVPDLLVDVGAIDRVAVAGERAIPGRDRLIVAADLEEQLSP